jgi:molybdenum cofactor cytidylyltransferase
VSPESGAATDYPHDASKQPHDAKGMELKSTLQHVEAVVLAAGRSRRMGRPKQLLPLPGGTSVIERVVSNVAPHVERVIVVVGHLPGQVGALAARRGADIAVNSDVDLGMLASVQSGIRSLSAQATGVLLCLGDQPEVEGTSIAQVLQAANTYDIVIPTYHGRGGHPVFITRSFFGEILDLSSDTNDGLRTVVRGHPEQTHEIEVAREEVLRDMDTPVDYHNTWKRLEGPKG